MALDPSIYQNVGRVNFGAGLSSLLDQQRAREQQRFEQANTLASLAQQQQLGGLQINRLQREESQAPEERQYLLNQRNEALSEAQRKQTEMVMKQQFISQLPPEQQRQYLLGGNKDVILGTEKPVKTPDWQNPQYIQYQQDLERFKAGLKPDPSQQPRKPMTADQEAKYRQKFGEAYGTTINALQSSKNVTDLANELKTHKGLGGITGMTGYVPDYPGSDAAGARQKFETLQGKITKMAKDAAASSGSIGPMAVQEWKILRDQISAIDPTKLDEKQMQDVLDDLTLQAQNAARITEEAYTSTFSPDFEMYSQFANPRGGMPKQDANDDITDLLNKYK